MSIRPARLFLLLLAPVAAISLGSGLSAQGGHQNPGVVPPGALYHGQTYGEWSADWWQAAFAIPADFPSHPLTVGGAFEGEGGIVFLSAPVQAAGSPPQTLEVTIPSGTPVFLPIITAECSVFEPPPFHGDDEPSLRACANDLIDLVSDVSAEIDGRPVNIGAYRAESPLFRWGPMPANNVMGAPAGTSSDAVSDGYFLMLPPLSVGVHHVIVRAAVEDFGIEVDTEFIITVDPRGK